MEKNSRQAELAASEVVSPSLLASAPDPLFPRWLCPPQFELGVGDEWEGPFADIYETIAEQDHFILEASQQLDAEGAPGPAPANRRLDDAEVDELLLMASQALESATEKVPPDDPRPGTDKDRFSSPVSSTEVQEVRKRGVPKKTAAQTGWAAKVWVDWAKQRLTKPFVDEEEEKCVLCEGFTSMQVNSMKCWLPKFVLEIRRRDGAYYPPDTLYGICTGLNRSLKSADRADINIFTDSGFICFRETLDSQMKQLKATGNYQRKKAEVVKPQHEDLLWEKGLLGDNNPKVLLDTMVYYIGLYFAIRGGEHRHLRHNPSQLHLYEPFGETPYLCFTEDVSKTNQGGLLHRKKAPKQVVHHANLANSQRCLIRLYKLYNEHCPANRPDNAFYLKPLEKPRPDCWYTRTPVGHNMLSRMVSRLFQEAGVTGHFTNHSLRATAATRMFDAGMDEQLIMHRTGHSSSVGVRSYKRITDSLKEKTSNVLNANAPPTKKKKLDMELPTLVDNKENKPMRAPTHSINFAGAANFTVNFNY